MNELLREFLSSIVELGKKANNSSNKPKTPGETAKDMGLDDMKFGRYGKNGKVTHVTDDSGTKLIPFTGQQPTDIKPTKPQQQTAPATPPTPTQQSVQTPTDDAKERAKQDQKTSSVFAYLDRPSSRIVRRMAMYAFETTISDRLPKDKKQQGKKLLLGIENLLTAHSNGDKKTVKALAKQLHNEFKFYSNTSGTSFKTQAFGMGERHFLGKTALAKDLVQIFETAGVDVRAEEDQDKGYKKALSGTSKPDLGEKFLFKKSVAVQKILGGFPQVEDKFKQLFGPKGANGDLLDNTGGKNCKTYFQHSVTNNKSLDKTQELLRKKGLDKMADSIVEHQGRMNDIAKNWEKYTPKQREDAVAKSYATMAVRLHATKFGGDAELCSAIMKNLAEVNLYDQELAGGKEVYMPSHGSFPAADKIVRVKAGTKAERIDKISVKFGKSGRVYGMPAQSSTICLLHTDSFYHNLTGGRVGLPDYETGVRSSVVFTDKNWKRLMDESGYSKYINQKQQKELLSQFKHLQTTVETERGRLKKKNIKDLVLMMKNNPKIEAERKKLEKVISGLDLDKLSQHIGSTSTSLMQKSPISFASLMTTHASILTAKGFPDLLHCHQEIDDTDDDGEADFAIGIDEGDADLSHWVPLWREADERGGGLLIGFSKG